MRRVRSRPSERTLQQTAALLFALMSIIPLLTFAYALHRLKAVGDIALQMSLGLALLVALLGFWLFRSLAGRIAELLAVVGQAVTRSDRPGTGQPNKARRSMVPGLTRVREVGDLVEIIGLMWKREAAPYLGRAVLVLVRGAEEPMEGTLIKIDEEGLLLQVAGARVPISYPRISAIDARSPDQPSEGRSIDDTVPLPWRWAWTTD